MVHGDGDDGRIIFYTKSFVLDFVTHDLIENRYEKVKSMSSCSLRMFQQMTHIAPSKGLS